MKNGLSFSYVSRCGELPIRRADEITSAIIPLEGCSLSIGSPVEEGSALVSDESAHAPFGGVVDNIILHRGQQYYYFKKDPSLPRKTYTPQEPMKKRATELIGQLRRCGVEAWEKASEAHKNIQSIVINGLESEPFLCADTRIFWESTKEVLLGAEYLRSLCFAKEIIIVLPRGSPLLERILKIVGGVERFRIHEMDNLYPQAYDKFILAHLFGTELPREASNIQLQAEVFSPSALLAVEEALLFNKPQTETVITVDGPFCAEYGNFRVPIGTPVHYFLRPYSTVDSYVIINGGPIAGSPMDPKKGVDKKTRALLIFTPAKRPAPCDCTSCGLCLEVCPINLNPIALSTLLQRRDSAQAEAKGRSQCIGCHACSYVCPSFIPLGRNIFKESSFNA